MIFAKPLVVTLIFFIVLTLNSDVDSKKTSTSDSTSSGSSSTSSGGGSHQQKSVKLTLTSKWRQTPFLLEISEFLAEENPDLFWSFIDLIEEKFGQNVDVGSFTTKEQYDVGLRFADKLLRSKSKLAILKFSLSLRSYSPTVAMFQQITDDIMAPSLNSDNNTSSSDSLQNCDSFVELSFDEKLLETEKFKRFSCSRDEIRESLETLVAYLKQTSENLQPQLRNPLLYSIDHQFPVAGSQTKLGTIILYGNIGTTSFFELHRTLKKIVSNSGNQLRYAVRHYYTKSHLPITSAEKVGLSGYGVELAIKSTEYKQQDDTRVRGEAAAVTSNSDSDQKPDHVSGFVFSKLRELFPDQHEKLSEFQNYLIDTDKEIATLKVWELQEISLQAATKVMSVNKDEALKALKDIAQNFPSVARSLAKISVDQDLKREILKNQHYFMHNLNLGTTDSALFINGLYYDVDSVDVFSLFDLIKQEQDVVDKLYRLLNGDSEKIRKFIKLDVSFEKQDYQIDIRDGSVNYVNNIEEDRNYRNWPVGLHEMLRPSYPGMMRSVRRNIFHLVLVVDPSQKSSHDIIQMAESFYLYKAPVRIGLVFAVNQNSSVTGLEDAGVACLEAFNYISQEKTPYEALSFLTDLIAKAAQQSTSTSINSGSDPGNLKPEYVLEHFKAKIGKSNLEDIFGADSEFDTGRQLAWDFVTRTGIGEAPKALLNGVLLKDSYLNLNYFEDVVLSEVMKQTTPLQKAIYKGEISDDEESVLDWLMNKETVMPRLNRIILGIDQQQSVTQSIVDFSGTAQKTSSTSGSSDFKQMNVKDLQATLVSSLRYINTKTDSPNPVTVWLVSDFRSTKNRHIFLAALAHLRQSSSTMRLAPIYHSYSVFNRITEAAFQSFQTATPKQLILFMQKFLRYSIENPDVDPESEDETVKKIFDFIPEEFRSGFNEKYEKLLPKSEPFQLYPEFSNRILNLSPDDFVVILNGKVYRVPDSEPFIEADFSLMEKFINNLITDKVMPLLTDKELLFGGSASGAARKGSDLILKISAALLGKSQSKTRYDVTNIREDHSVLLLEPRDVDQPFVELSAVLDPLSRGTQKISPILETLYQVFNARIKIYFNCVDKHSDMPLKSYYRFVLDEEPQFDSGTGELLQPTALFSSMPKTPLFTLGMAVPENWLVEAVESVHDLDNIHLERIEGSTVSAIFELEHLLVEGHCFEQSSGTPPRGLQFTLGTESNPVMFDTIVMANLGYFQLKANPGIWMLKLRQGRSDDIYTIVSHEGGTDQLVANASEVIPIVSNFRSLVIKIRVNKKPGKQNEELLYDSEEGGSADANGGGDNSLWSSFSWGSEDSNSKKKSSDGSNVTSNDDEDSKRINIFSLASGHLYERLLRIMMTSVLKHTKTPVKFWFLKNYLSPHFKNVLPFMAEKYGFDYELVEYKWPRWLHQQTEKQRIIWGYKILFLDVLFPLDVKKIIFVDADQVVRADLKELRDLDLEGAPYGYTPFCDSRKEMDGFRFWKSGYWQTHLHGRKYHISALYVVDLQKFRRIAAGDRLRGQYQGLSQDPNSLSNLDQDLPNNMIHQVAIKSLPQEWLWCETWCSDDSKKKAKTIDLCNNPKTKEPKLTGARRIVSEWEDYDRELKKMMDQYNNSQQQQETKDNKKDSSSSNDKKPEVTENSHQEL